MLETILSVLAASIVIFVAHLLIKKQRKRIECVKDLEDNIFDSLEDIADEVEALSGQEAPKCTIIYLEKRLDMLEKTLQSIPSNNKDYKGRSRYAKNQKHS